MRQAGVLAAAGIVALETMTGRLMEDHARARRLAEGISRLPHLHLWPGLPATNMVFFDLGPEIHLSDAQIEQEIEKRGVLIHASNPRRFRLVTHYWIDDAAVQKALSALQEVLAC